MGRLYFPQVVLINCVGYFWINWVSLYFIYRWLSKWALNTISCYRFLWNRNRKLWIIFLYRYALLYVGSLHKIHVKYSEVFVLCEQGENDKDLFFLQDDMLEPDLVHVETWHIFWVVGNWLYCIHRRSIFSYSKSIFQDCCCSRVHRFIWLGQWMLDKTWYSSFWTCQIVGMGWFLYFVPRDGYIQGYNLTTIKGSHTDILPRFIIFRCIWYPTHRWCIVQHLLSINIHSHFTPYRSVSQNVFQSTEDAFQTWIHHFCFYHCCRVFSNWISSPPHF